MRQQAPPHRCNEDHTCILTSYDKAALLSSLARKRYSYAPCFVGHVSCARIIRSKHLCEMRVQNLEVASPASHPAAEAL